MNAPGMKLHYTIGNRITSRWRSDFPALSTPMNGKRLAFLDSGASAQKPYSVLNALQNAYCAHYANIHRGLYEFSQRQTADFEAAREKVAQFIGAGDVRSIIFTRNSTEAINLVAQSWGRQYLQAGDEVILTVMEHHANLVPWHILKTQIGIEIKYIPLRENGELDLEVLPQMLSARTKLLAMTHVSNVLGTVNPVREVIAQVKHSHPHVKILIDGSQAVVHSQVNMREIGADFYAFTGHKLYGPTGIGVLYAPYEILDSMPPWQGGGDMIDRVRLDGVSFAPPPARFEAGTPAIAEAIALGAAIEYINSIGYGDIAAHEHALRDELTQKLEQIEGVKIYGTQPDKAAIVSFTMDGCPAADVAMILDQNGVAVRVGHHCCQPLMQCLGVEHTIRASIGLYNDSDDIDQLIAGLIKAQKLLL